MVCVMAAPYFRGAIGPMDKGGCLSKSRHRSNEAGQRQEIGKEDAEGTEVQRTGQGRWLSSGASPGVVA